MAGSTRLAICDVDSPCLEADVAFVPADPLPCDNPTAAPAPTPAATTAVAASPSIVRPRCRFGGSGTYCPNGYCANGSLIGTATPNLIAALLLATPEGWAANLGALRMDSEPRLAVC